MKSGKTLVNLIFLGMSVILLLIPLSACGSSNSFPYQGSINGNWSGQLTIINRSIPIGGIMSISIDNKGVVTGTLSSTSGGANPATINGQVNSDGNLTGTVSFTINATTFISNWQGTITSSGKSLNMQGTWTSQHGSGSFSGNGTTSK